MRRYAMRALLAINFAVTFVSCRPAYRQTIFPVVATPSHSSEPTPSATPTPTPTPTATATPTPSPSPTATPTPQPLSVSPASLAFSQLGAQLTFEADESAYSGAITATSTGSTTCAGIASFAPSQGNGPAATFTVTSVANGVCQITVTDTFGQTAQVTINVAHK